MKRVIYLILGCVGLGLGTIGVVVPVLPTVPFYMLAAFAFAKSSKRLYAWFLGTKLYKENLETYMEGQGMTWGAKRRIMGMVTILMIIGFTMMALNSLYIPCMILGCVWLFHVYYFMMRVRTIQVRE